MNKENIIEQLKEIYDTKVQELDEKYKESVYNLTNEYTKLIEKLDKVKDLKEVYYVIDEYGEVTERHMLDEKRVTKLKEVGNFFETEEEAKEEIRKRKLIQKAKNTQGWPYRKMEDFILYFTIANETFTGKIGVVTLGVWLQNPELGYWAYKEEAEKFLEENIEELKWFFLKQ